MCEAQRNINGRSSCGHIKCAGVYENSDVIVNLGYLSDCGMQFMTSSHNFISMLNQDVWYK